MALAEQTMLVPISIDDEDNLEKIEIIPSAKNISLLDCASWIPTTVL
jgi:hypothetical protein